MPQRDGSHNILLHDSVHALMWDQNAPIIPIDLLARKPITNANLSL